jgi:hypothetical protein
VVTVEECPLARPVVIVAEDEKDPDRVIPGSLADPPETGFEDIGDEISGGQARRPLMR